MLVSNKNALIHKWKYFACYNSFSLRFHVREFVCLFCVSEIHSKQENSEPTLEVRALFLQLLHLKAFSLEINLHLHPRAAI